jgi:hypothetical protein
MTSGSFDASLPIASIARGTRRGSLAETRDARDSSATSSSAPRRPSTASLGRTRRGRSDPKDASEEEKDFIDDARGDRRDVVRARATEIDDDDAFVRERPRAARGWTRSGRSGRSRRSRRRTRDADEIEIDADEIEIEIEIDDDARAREKRRRERIVGGVDEIHG